MSRLRGRGSRRVMEVLKTHCDRCGKPHPDGAVTVPENVELVCFQCAHPAEWDLGEFL